MECLIEPERSPSSNGRDYIKHDHLFVAEPFQGCGLASQLWDIARRACGEEGNERKFTVNSSKFAVGMYKRFGFVETGPPQNNRGVVSIPMKLVGESE